VNEKQKVKNMASRDLEKEFDPTQWSTRIGDPKKLLESHVEFGNRGEFRVDESVKVI
jgi:hypothetical protein